MERLWTPWRLEYVRTAGEGDSCVFCDLPAQRDDAEALIVARSELSFIVLNRFPYNPGHLMIAPFRHVGDLPGLSDEELDDTSRLVRRSIEVIGEWSQPGGFNVGMNLGRVAGAGIPGHLHWHVVPRWGGDTNFMPVIGQTKVLPELLAETYAKLKPLFAGA